MMLGEKSAFIMHLLDGGGGGGEGERGEGSIWNLLTEGR